MKKIVIIGLIGSVCLFVTGCGQDPSKMLENNIKEKCKNYTSYLKANFGGGEGQIKGVADVGVCDNKFVVNLVNSKSASALSFTYDYRQKEYQFNNNDIINNAIGSSLYYIERSDNKNWIRMILKGTSWNDIDNYENEILKIAKELKGTGTYKIFIHLSADSDINTNYHKAALVYSLGSATDDRIEGNNVKIILGTMNLTIESSDTDNTIKEEFETEKQLLIDQEERYYKY